MEAHSLARIWKLQEHVWEQGRALAPGTSLRLEVTLLAAASGASDLKVSPCHGCASDLCGQKYYWWLWGFWGHRLGIADLVRLEVEWASSFVVLALRKPEKALWWPLSQLPRYTFCGICGNELEGMALAAWGQKKITFSSLANPLPLLLLYWHGDTQKGHLGVVYPFMTHHFYCSQDCTQECA